jgi:Uma2 family endonuclease
MATAPNFPLVSVDEYLSSSYEHDVEFVEGVLIERGMPTIAHSILQKLLLLYFAQYESAMGFVALPEVRTKIGNLARYRIPDVMLCPRPLPKGRICDVEPWVVVEVLSPDDTLAGTRSRFRDYAGIGVQHLILMDPEEYIAYRFENGSLIETTFETLPIRSGASIPFQSAKLFDQLRAQIS